jgi:hypothetical protein
MLNPSELSKIVQVAQADYGDTPPNERKRPEDIKAATLRISSLITENPLEIFTIMVENGIPGLHHFEIPHLETFQETAIQEFTLALTDPTHRWYTYSKVVHTFARLDNSINTLNIIMKRLNMEIEERLGFAYRFYPNLGYALKLFDAGIVIEKIIAVLKNASWNNRYYICMSIRNVARGSLKQEAFAEVFHYLEKLADADTEEANKASKEKIELCRLQIKLALAGK